jgi:hypothetical protein
VLMSDNMALKTELAGVPRGSHAPKAGASPSYQTGAPLTSRQNSARRATLIDATISSVSEVRTSYLTHLDTHQWWHERNQRNERSERF